MLDLPRRRGPWDGVLLALHGSATVVYWTNPHLDARMRVRECADIIRRTIRGEVHPVQALEMPPLVINIVKQLTGEEPMRGLTDDDAALWLARRLGAPAHNLSATRHRPTM